LVEGRPETQLVDQGADDQDRPPSGRIDHLRFRGTAGITLGIASEEASELGK